MVELALGSDLLLRTEGGVDQAEADADQRVVVAAERQQRGADDEQDRVVEVEDVGPQDPRVGARASGDRRVALARAAPLLSLGRGQPAGGAAGACASEPVAVESMPAVFRAVVSPRAAGPPPHSL